MSSEVINWREKHKKIKEWKEWTKQKKLKQKLEINEVMEESEQNDTIKDQSSDQIDVIARNWTASIAVPSSIVDNAQSPELKAYLCGQIARALVIFQIDEIVIFDEYSKQTTFDTTFDNSSDESLLYDKRNAAMIQMIRILQYLECPQYLRKYLFPIQKDLQFAGLTQV